MHRHIEVVRKHGDQQRHQPHVAVRALILITWPKPAYRSFRQLPRTPLPAHCEVAEGCGINLSFVRVADHPLRAPGTASITGVFARLLDGRGRSRKLSANLPDFTAVSAS